MAKQKKKSVSKSSHTAFTVNRAPITACLFIFVFAFLLYSNTLHHGFVMDDGAVITNHETVKKGFSGIKELFGQSSVYGSTKENFGTYRPLTMSLFAAEWSFFKGNPAGYHFIQVLLFSILCVMIYVVLKKLLKNFSPLLPAAAALLFIAHPIHTEVAANIKSADEMLSLLFCLLALFFAVKFAETSGKRPACFSFLFFLLALFSKESAATFLFIIPLALYFFLPMDLKSKRKNIITVSGLYLSALAIYFLARNASLDNSPNGVSLINNTLAGANTFSERYATILVILFKYLKLLFYPHPLCWDYGYNQIPLVGFGDPMAIVSLLIYIVIGIYALLVLFKSPGLKSQVSLLFVFCFS